MTVLDRDGLTAEQWARVEANTGLVWFVINRMRLPLGVDRDDVYQDGILGLARAVQLHNPDKGTLSTYAVQWIRQAIHRGRGQLEGVNWRRSFGDTAGDRAYKAPLSLDMHVGRPDEDGRPFVDTIGDSSVDVDGDATAAALADHARRVAAPACRDQLDRDCLDAIVADDLGRGGRARLAMAHGARLHVVESRIRRLRAVLSHPLAGLNPAPWAAGAPCVGAPATDYFMPRGVPATPRVRERCEACPVAAQCRESTGYSEPGFRGGRSRRTRSTAP